MGNAPRTWALSAAAVLFLRHHEPGQKLLARWGKKAWQGQSPAPPGAYTRPRCLLDAQAPSRLCYGPLSPALREQSTGARGLTRRHRDEPDVRMPWVWHACVGARPGVPRPCIP